MPQGFRLTTALVASLTLVGSAWADAAQPMSAGCHDVPGRARHAILMIADGVGFNGWIGAGYHAHGATRGYRYQQPFAAPVESALVGVSTQALHLAPSPIDAGYEPDERWRHGLFDVSGPRTTDSAAASTAMHTGTKTLRRHVGLDAEGRPLESLHRLAKKRGLTAGVVTSVQMAHATPAAAWARMRDRDGYAAILEQMTDGGLDVLIGAGHPGFDDAGKPVETPSDEDFVYVGGREFNAQIRDDGTRYGYAFSDRRGDFEKLAAGEWAPPKLLGLLPVRQTLHQARPRGAARAGHLPHLSLLSTAALESLSAGGGGFVLTIEGGAIDWANHANDLGRFLEEMREFEQAVDTVVAWVERESCWQDTLLVITADHETGGLWPAASWHDVDGDGRYTPKDDRFIGHAAPGPTARGATPDLRYGTNQHTSDLVPLWAIGRGARRFVDGARHDRRAEDLWGPAWAWDGRYVDNTRVFQVMAEALGLHDDPSSRGAGR